MSGTEYHLRTEYERDRMPAHFLDWAHQPGLYKSYPHLRPVALPRDIQLPKVLPEDVFKRNIARKGITPLDLGELSQVLLLTYSLTAKARQLGSEAYYRSVASAGALYPTELYVFLSNVLGIDDGLYHYGVGAHCLTPLRTGEAAGFPAEMLYPKPDGIPPLTVFFSAIFFRSAWKYRERAYRYHLLDTGHVVENLVAALQSLGLSPRLSYDFHDDQVQQFLGVDPSREACLAVCRIPAIHAGKPVQPPEALPPLPQETLAASRTATSEREYPLIRKTHEDGCLTAPPAAPHTPGPEEPQAGRKTGGTSIPHNPWPQTCDYAAAVFRRRSQRNFVPDPVPRERFNAVLDALVPPPGSDHTQREPYSGFLRTGVLIRSVEKLDPGFYEINPRGGLALRSQGNLTEKMAHACLDQMWLSAAAVHFVFFADVAELERTRGSRAYRYAMLTAGRLGQRLYVLAASMGLGCCGIGAFYDREAANLLQFKEDQKLLYLVGLGAVKK